MIQTRLTIKKDGVDISDDCVLSNGKANPFGWSQYEILFKGSLIGFLENGIPDMEKGYTFELTEI